MARNLRVEYPGAIYHVTVRSNGQEMLFKTDGDRKYLLSRMGEAAERHQVRVYLLSSYAPKLRASSKRCRGNDKRSLFSILRADPMLSLDKRGADLLFQVISARYERGASIITTNTAYKQWPRVFNNDATITTAILDRLLHHCETVTIEGKSYRMKDKS